VMRENQFARAAVNVETRAQQMQRGEPHTERHDFYQRRQHAFL
jgi:hypothetical protein